MLRAAGLFIVFTVTATTASAFGTVNILGQSAEHEKITRLGLKSFGLGSKTLDAIAGKRGTFGAVGAPDKPGRGLLSKQYAHCDGGDVLAVAGYPQSRKGARRVLRRCQRWILRWLETAIKDAGRLVDRDGRIRGSEIPTWVPCIFNGKSGRAKCDALGALGLVFHAAQDFYSHTNWTDRPARGAINAENPPGLNQRGLAPWIQPGGNRKPPKGLISGCFEGIPERYKCKYGNRQHRIKHAYLNKDKGRINGRTGNIGAAKTARGKINQNFRHAVQAAIADTKNKWRYFELQIHKRYGSRKGRRIVCAMRSDSPANCS